MAILYGPNLAKRWGHFHQIESVRMRLFVPSQERSDVFLSYRHGDENTAIALAMALDSRNLDVYIDVFDDTLVPQDFDLDNKLVETIRETRSLVIVVSKETHQSWWVPWEVGVSTPFGKPRAIFVVESSLQLPTFLGKLRRFSDRLEVVNWVETIKRRREVI